MGPSLTPHLPEAKVGLQRSDALGAIGVTNHPNGVLRLAVRIQALHDVADPDARAVARR
jgi:hypothetical protein